MWNMESIIDEPAAPEVGDTWFNGIQKFWWDGYGWCRFAAGDWKDVEHELCEGVKTKSIRQIEKEMLDADYSNAKTGDTFVTDTGSTFVYNGEEWCHHPHDVVETGLDSLQLETLANELNAIMNDWQPESSAVGLDAALNSCILITLRMYYRNPGLTTKFGDATTGFTYAYDDAGWFNMYDINEKLGEERLNRENLGKDLGKKIREQHEKEELAALRIATAPTKEQLESFELGDTIGTFDTAEIDPDDCILFHDSNAVITLAQPVPMSFDIVNDNETLVKIDMDTGEVEFGENYTPSEAAKFFWDSLGVYHPKNCTCRDVFFNTTAFKKLWNSRHKTFDNAMKVLGNG